MSLSAENDRLDQELARSAIEKRRRGEQPMAKELAALRRVQKRADEESARRHYAACPKRIYRELSGRKDKVILEQAAQYGIPIGGAEVDLGAVLRWIHDAIAAGRFRQLGNVGGENFEWMPEAQKSRLGEEQIRKTHEQANILELERLEKERELLPREAVHELHGRIASIFRTCADRLQKQFGEEARRMFVEALDNAERSVASLLESDAEEVEKHGGDCEAKDAETAG